METFIFFTLKSSICLAAGYLLYFLLLRKETFHRFKRFILLGIILISLIVPVIKMQISATTISLPVQKLESTIIREAPVVETPIQTAQFPLRKPKSKPVNFLLLVYLSGAAIQLMLILYSLTRILLLLLKSKRISYKGIRLALTSSKITPFCFGRYILISEKDFTENKKEVLLHEQTHLKERHYIDLLISVSYLIMTWYNPVSWLICHELKQNSEFEADRNVLSQGVDESNYQLLLVRTVAGETRFHLANQFNQSSIKTRIIMMNKRKSNRWAILKALLFLPLIALMVQAFAKKEIKSASAVIQNQPRGKNLILKPDQLKKLGFEYNSEGLFYKNERPDVVEYKELDMIFNKKVYSSSILKKKGEKPVHFSGEKIIDKMTTTNFDFFPLVVSNYKGQRTLVMGVKLLAEQKKLLPVQVNMAELNINGRSDTLVFWFLPTASLKKELSPITNMDDYLQVIPPDTRKVEAKKKK
jgi:beta-lactamase regulating signal transducer with metallopeptidase domain